MHDLWGGATAHQHRAQPLPRAGRGGGDVAHDFRRAVRVPQAHVDPGAAERLDVSPQHVSRLVDAGEFVALADGGQLRLPAWQFHADTPRGRLEGIDVVARAHAGGPVTLSQWMTRPNPALAGRSPAEALADGEVDAVASAAREGV